MELNQEINPDSNIDSNIDSNQERNQEMNPERNQERNPESYKLPEMAGMGTIIQLRTDICKRFYEILFKLFESENHYKEKAQEFFQIENQLQRDPEKYLEPNDYYIHSIALFYILGFNSNDNQFHLKSNCYSPDEIWLRYCSKAVMIKLDEKSGSLYQSPYENHLGMIYIGREIDEQGKRLGYWFAMEERKGLKYLTSFYMSRSSPIHWMKDSLIPSKIEIPKKVIQNPITESILKGEISDAEMRCLDGDVNISKGLLSCHSDYFFSLFKLEKKFTYHLEMFEKSILINYIYFCANQSFYFDPKMVTHYLTFGEFIQDPIFLEHIYNEIYQHRSWYSNKDLIDFIKNFQKIGFDILK